MLICMQKISFITHLFLKILQRNSKLVILVNLGMPGHIHLKWWYQFEEIFDAYLQVKKSASFFLFSLRYFKNIANLLFLVLCESLITHTQNDSITLQKHFRICLQTKEQLHPPCFPGDNVFLEIFGVASTLG